MQHISNLHKPLFFVILLAAMTLGWQGVVNAADEAGASSVAEEAATVNINEASAAQIAETLTGIGEKRAQAIVAYRSENGDFESLEELMAVKGVGEKTIEANASKISF